MDEGFVNSMGRFLDRQFDILWKITFAEIPDTPELSKLDWIRIHESGRHIRSIVDMVPYGIDCCVLLSGVGLCRSRAELRRANYDGSLVHVCDAFQRMREFRIPTTSLAFVPARDRADLIEALLFPHYIHSLTCQGELREDVVALATRGIHSVELVLSEQLGLESSNSIILGGLRFGKAQLLESRGKVLAKNGELDRALQDLEKSRDLKISLGEPAGETHSSLANLYLGFGHFSKAEAAAKSAIEDATDPKNCAIARVNLGQLYRVARDYDRAMAEFDRVLAETNKFSTAFQSNLRFNIVASRLCMSVELHRKMLPVDVEEFKQMEPTLLRSNLPPNARILFFNVKAKLSMLDPEIPAVVSQRYIEQMIHCARHYRIEDMVFSGKLVLGEHFYLTSQFQTARIVWSSLFETMVANSLRLEGHPRRISYFVHLSKLADALSWLLYTQFLEEESTPRTILQIVEKSKCACQMFLRSSFDDELKIDLPQEGTFVYYSVCERAGLNAEGVFVWVIQDQEIRYFECLKIDFPQTRKLIGKFEDFYRSTRKILRRLRFRGEGGEFEGEDDFQVFSFDDLSLFRGRRNGNEEQSTRGSCLAQQSAMLQLRLDVLPDRLLRVLRHLDTRSFVVIPDKFLWKIPFCCLILADGSLLYEKWQFSVAASLQACANIRQVPRQLPSQGAVVVGDLQYASHRKLSQSKGETRGVASKLQPLCSNVRVLSGENVSVDLLCEAVSSVRPRFFHVATHFISESAPRELNSIEHPFADFFMHGKLCLSGENMISARELSKLDFSMCEVAFLNGCESGLGRVVQEGILGFRRGLLRIAGCSRVICSLWPVVDVVAGAIARFFYAQLSSEGSFAQMLQRSLLRADQMMLKKFRLTFRALPFVLGGYQLYGLD